MMGEIHMNWILVAVIVILFVSAWQGYRKGIIRIAVSLASMIVAMIACVFVTPVVSSAVKNQTEVYDKMTESIYEMLINSGSFNQAFEEVSLSGRANAPEVEDLSNLSDGAEAGNGAGLGNITVEELSALENNINKFMEEVSSYMNFPDSIMKNVDIAEFIPTVNQVVEQGAVSVEHMIAAIFAARLADMAIHAIVYITVFVVVFVILKIVLLATNIIASLPIIRQANKAVGLVFGILEGLVVVWLVFAIITACSNFSWAADALALIGDNGFLRFLYENNLITRTIMG